MLALLVVLSLILISASFGGSSGGPLNTVQSGFLDVLSPVETVASKALTPVHDLFTWVSDVFHASSQRNAARRQLAAAQSQLAAARAQAAANQDAARLLHMDRALNLAADGPVSAGLIGTNGSLWASTVTVDAGSGDGVRLGDPVIAPAGSGGALVGTVSRVAAGSAVVTLINDPSAAEAARDATSRELGVIAPEPGSPGQLALTVSSPQEIRSGDLVVTAGARATQNASLFPAGLVIGTVTGVPGPADPLGTITVAPAADLTSLEHLQILTSVPGA